jgi:hypothetical protein
VVNISNAEKLARMIIMFYRPKLTDDDRRLWHEMCGNRDITTKVLGDMARVVLKEEEDKNSG